MDSFNTDSLARARASYIAIANRASHVSSLLKLLSQKSIWFDWEQVVDILVKDSLSWCSNSPAYFDMRRELLSKDALSSIGTVESIQGRTAVRVSPFAVRGLHSYAVELGLERLASLGHLALRVHLENVYAPSSFETAVLSAWESCLLVRAINAQSLLLINALRELELGLSLVLEDRQHAVRHGPLQIVQEDSGIDGLLAQLLRASMLNIEPKPRMEYGVPAKSNTLSSLPSTELLFEV